MRRRILARRPSPAMVVALVALCSSLTGGAFAAALITGGDIKNRSITKKDLKANSVNSAKVQDQTLLVNDFAPGQLNQGASDVYTAGNGNGGPASAPPLAKNVPAGVYFVTAQVVIDEPTTSSEPVGCFLAAATEVSSVFAHLNNTDTSQETLVATLVTTLNEPGTIDWSCSNSNVSFGNATLHAVRLGAKR